jgi:hypothetical protein
LERWREVHAFFHAQNLKVEGVFADRRKYEAAIAHLEEGKALVAGDPYLESAYGEWAAQYYWDPKQERNIAYLRQALRRGYPAEHLLRRLIVLLEESGDAKEAARLRKAYFPNEPA